VGAILNPEEMKRAAAQAAADYVENGMTVGLGSGSTSQEFVRALGARVGAGLEITAVASSTYTADLARKVGILLKDLTGSIDIAIDGADAVDTTTLGAIKGLGGALTRERIVASAARTFIIIVDERKLFNNLSDSLTRIPIPIAIVPFGWPVTQESLREYGRPELRMTSQGSPYRTDDQNLIIDLYDARVESLDNLAADLKAMTGVVDHGLFLDLATHAVAGTARGIVELTAD
jgi:ribose 5-phosphate isomerase A